MIPRFIIAAVLSISYSAFGQGVWVSDSLPGFNMPFARSEVINDKIYVISEVSDLNKLTFSGPNRVSIFDPVIHKWISPETGVSPTNGAFASAVINGKIYTFGAEADTLINKVNVFDPATNTWTNIPYTGTFTSRYGFTASAVRGKIYTIGGEQKNPLGIVEVFDPSNATWSTLQTSGTFTARSDHSAVVFNEKIYIIGGDVVNPLPLEVFDPLTNSWSTPPVSGSFSPRAGLSASVLGGKIYAIGGYNFASKTNIIEAFDLQSNTWTTPSSTGIFTSRTNLSAGTVGDKIFVIGGTDFVNNGTTSFFLPGNHNEVFSPATNEIKTENESSGIQIFPNPSSGIITFSHDRITISKITITNYFAVSVSELTKPTAANFTVDLSNLIPGVYYARILTEHSTIMKKILLLN